MTAFFWARLLARRLVWRWESTSRFRMVRSTSCRIRALSSDSRFTATNATPSREPIRIAERTNILWASLRFFMVATRGPVAVERDWSGCRGQRLFDHGEEPTGVEHDEQLAAQLEDAVDQVGAARVRQGGLAVGPRERLRACDVDGPDFADRVDHHPECVAHRRLEQ